MSIIGQLLIQVLLPFVKVLNQIVSAMINMANAISAAMASIFGGTSKQIQQTQNDISSGIGGTVDSQKELTEETKETAKAQQKLLMAFDEINRLDSPSGGGGNAGGGGGGSFAPLTTVEVPVEVPAVDKITGFFDKLRAAIDPFWASIQNAISDIKEGAATLFATFKRAWTDIGKLGTPIKEWVGSEFIDFVNQAILTVGNSFGGLLDTVGKVFGDVWSVVIFPILQQWATDILPAMTEFGTEFLGAFDTLFDEVKTIFDRIWTEAVVPSLSVSQTVWSGFWDGVVAGWNEHGAPIFEAIKTTISNLSDTMQNVWDTTIKPIWDKLISTTDELWRKHLKPLWDNFVDLVAGVIKAAMDIYNGVISPVINWVVDLLGPIVASGVGNMVETFGNLLGTIADIINTVVSYLKGAVEFIAGVFTGDWERAWEGIKGIFADKWNRIAGILESFVNGIISIINEMFAQINSLKISIPDWVPVLGGSTIGFNIPSLNQVYLPRLAQGAVIPPNREFLAVLGDQGHGNNLEAPEDLIRQIVREEAGSASNDQLMVIVELIRQIISIMGSSDMDMRKIAEMVTSEQRKMARARGW